MFKTGQNGKAQKLLLLAAVGAMLLAAAPEAQAQEENKPFRPWSVSLQSRYFFSSSTSYEFGNPYPPYQIPLSRLEFPLNSWWIGASARRNFSRFSVGLEAMRNLTGKMDGKFLDSDWEDEEHPSIRSIYSESSCRMEPSYLVRANADLKLGDWLGLPVWFDARPVAGFSWQRFSLVTYDGTQYSHSPDGVIIDNLPGDGINFEQTYWLVFAGLKTTFDLGKPLRLSKLRLSLQADWAYVKAQNEDYHLLRAGKRLTYDHTTGDAWHGAASVEIGLTQNLSATIGLDYLRITTTGTHRMVNEPFGIDFSFDHGVSVWSQQTSFTAGLTYSF